MGVFGTLGGTNGNFTGQYEHKIDSKGRFVLPAAYREKLDRGLVITVGMERCACLYSKDTWDGFLAKLQDLPMAKGRVRDFMRVILASATFVEPDGMGRVLVPQLLRNYGDLMQDVSVIGVGDHVEIWNSHKWSEHRELVFAELASIAEELAL